jgi:hypothetical protein
LGVVNAGGMSQGQIVAAISAALLLVSLFLTWGGADVSNVPDLPAGVPTSPGLGNLKDAANFTGWESQNTLDIYLAIVAGLVLGNVGMMLSGNMDGLPFAPAAATFLLGVIGTIMTVYVLLDLPSGANAKIGLFLAIAAIIGVTVGSFLQMRDEVAEAY